MALSGFGLDAGRWTASSDAAPWAREYVQLTKQAHGALVMQANDWKARHGEQQTRAAPTRGRGQQPGARGHARTMQTNLPERVETIALDSPQCPSCGLGLKAFAGTQRWATAGSCGCSIQLRWCTMFWTPHAPPASSRTRLAPWTAASSAVTATGPTSASRGSTQECCWRSAGLSVDINRPVDDLCLTKGWPGGPARPARPPAQASWR